MQMTKKNSQRNPTKLTGNLVKLSPEDMAQWQLLADKHAYGNKTEMLRRLLHADCTFRPEVEDWLALQQKVTRRSRAQVIADSIEFFAASHGVALNQKASSVATDIMRSARKRSGPWQRPSKPCPIRARLSVAFGKFRRFGSATVAKLTD